MAPEPPCLAILWSGGNDVSTQPKAGVYPRWGGCREDKSGQLDLHSPCLLRVLKLFSRFRLYVFGTLESPLPTSSFQFGIFSGEGAEAGLEAMPLGRDLAVTDSPLQDQVPRLQKVLKTFGEVSGLPCSP